MDPVLNPYTPNAGAEPEAMVGRDDQLASFEVLLRRLARRRTEQSMIITGLRGVGKTVLLNQFERKAKSEGWVVIELEATKSDEASFRVELGPLFHSALLELSPRKRWSERMSHAASVIKSFTMTAQPDGGLAFGLDVEAAEGLADHGVLSRDLTDMFVAVGEATRDKEIGLVLLIDEVQFLGRQQLEAVISALHKTVQRKLPITMVGAGLPQIAELAGDAKSYAERLFKFPEIANFNEADAKEALARPAADEGVEFEDAALDEAVRITEGYPYFIQELGYAVWSIAENGRITKQDITDAIPAYTSKLDTSFFRVRLDRCTELQRSYLRAMADLGPGPQKAIDVAERMNRTSQNQGPTRAELISMGLLYTPTHGFASFTVPQFDAYMLRAVPKLEVPEWKRRA
ncbi:ATP-binding protein [Nesterenkonia haasae]|uniref:ATP-binding protein n=1 Tax=Nesterenkonia haasae TaxID=2587813 RepID=UPI001391D8E2|nr:ATP-binding protein [Nesterenkonia haasae]NDK31168.1 ATP-binding protein [Nesterenkonia haasae]